MAGSPLESHSSRTPDPTGSSPFKAVGTDREEHWGEEGARAGVHRTEEDWRCVVPRDAGTAMVLLPHSRWVLAPASATPRHWLHCPGCCSKAINGSRMMAKPP